MAKAMRRHAQKPDGNRTEEWFGPDGNHLTLYVPSSHPPQSRPQHPLVLLHGVPLGLRARVNVTHDHAQPRMPEKCRDCRYRYAGVSESSRERVSKIVEHERHSSFPADLVMRGGELHDVMSRLSRTREHPLARKL